MTSSSISLHAGSVVAYNNETWRICEVDSLTRVLAARISDDHREFINIADLTAAHPSLDEAAAAEVQRAIRALPARHECSPEELRELDDAIARFQDLVKILDTPRNARGSLLNDYVAKYSCHRATAFRHLKLVKAHGCAQALLSAPRSDTGANHLPKETVEVIDNHLKKYRLVPTPKTLPDILEFVNGALRRNDLKEVSLSTLYVRLRKFTYKDQMEAQGRKEQVRNQFEVKAGHLPDNDYPLGIVQVDHTPLQICFVDETYREPINDAWLTLVIDCYSRMVLGFYITFDAPSALSTGMALGRAFLPKDNYLQQQGVKGSWSCWGIPDVIIVDNAAELNGRMMHSARARYRFDLRDRPVGSPNFGGHVESAFKTFMYEIKSLPGTKFSNPVERAEYDSEGRAVLTLRAFERLFTEFLVNDYHLREHSGAGMNGRAPLQRWEQGLLHGDVFPPTGLPDIPVNPDVLKVSLMPIETRVVSKGTVELHGLTYYSNDLKLISDRLDPRDATNDRKFEIRYDPRDISCLWVWDSVANAYVTATNADHTMGSISLWEWRAIKRSRKGLTDGFKDQRYESKVRREEIKEQEIKHTKQTRREAEKARLRAADSLVKPPSPTRTTTPPPAATPDLTEQQISEMRAKVRTSMRK